MEGGTQHPIAAIESGEVQQVLPPQTVFTSSNSSIINSSNGSSGDSLVVLPMDITLRGWGGNDYSNYNCETEEDIFALERTNGDAVAAVTPSATTTAATSDAVTASIPSTAVPKTSPLYINDYFTIRPESDRFGRGITDVRRALTKQDTAPFPTSSN